jgi:hypothetical protein
MGRTSTLYRAKMAKRWVRIYIALTTVLLALLMALAYLSLRYGDSLYKDEHHFRDLLLVDIGAFGLMVFARLRAEYLLYRLRKA